MKGIEPFLIFWQAHPFLRLLLPLMGGILLADVGEGYSFPLELLAWSEVFLLCIGLGLAFTLHSYRFRYLFGCWCFLFFFFLGFGVGCNRWREVKTEWPTEATVYEANLLDYPHPKRRSYLCEVRLKAFLNGNVMQQKEVNLLLYLPKDSLVEKLQPGDNIRFYGEIRLPASLSKVETFDYARYLYHHDVSGTLYTTHWQFLNRKNGGGWKEDVLKLRKGLLEFYASSGLSGDELAVLSALTLGYKEDLSEEMEEQYSVSGASHVLALSGLHVGILCMVIGGFLNLLIPGIRLRWLRGVGMIIGVWLFVWLVEMPVSAIRAATMCTLFIIGSFFTRVGFAMNTLAVTAFFMLLFQPFNLFDVGFQMSFVAVASILLLQRMFYDMLPRISNPVLRYGWEITTLSIVAQIGVAPLILFYFSRFSVYFLLTNLWVIPLTWLIVTLSLPFLLSALLPWEWLHSVFALLLEWLIGLMNKGVEWLHLLPGAAWDNWSPSIWMVGLLYGAMGSLCWAFRFKSGRALVVALFSIAAICLLELCR